MALELYNSTRRIKEVPKFNYTGKIVLKPEEVYGIEDYMFTFYKPYERIGVIIRNSIGVIEVPVEKEIEEIVNAHTEVKEEVPVVQNTEVKFEGTLEVEVPENPVIVEEGKQEEVEVEETANAEEEISEEVEVEETTKYTKKQLNSMKMEELKEIIEKLGIKPPKYKRDSYVKAILDAQG